MSLPFMPLYVSDYLADTAHLSAAEHGAYLLLIMHYWRQGGLPESDAAKARIARMNADEWAAARDVLAEFFTGDWRHKRIDAELEKAMAKHDRRVSAGSRGGKQKASNARAGLEPGCSNALASSSEPEPDKKERERDARAREPDPPPDLTGQPIPADWQPSEADRMHAELSGMTPGDIEREADAFRDHYRARLGERRSDWSAQWRNWCRRRTEFAARAPPAVGRQAPKTNPYFDILRELKRDDAGHQGPALDVSITRS